MPEGAPGDWGFLEWLSSAIVEMFAACGELKEYSRGVAIGWASMCCIFGSFEAVLGGASFFYGLSGDTARQFRQAFSPRVLKPMKSSHSLEEVP